MLKYDKAPVQYMVPGLKLYIEEGIDLGDFMMAMLTNDLRETFGRTDENNRANIFEWVVWLWNEFPANAWGSPEKVAAYTKAIREQKEGQHANDNR